MVHDLDVVQQRQRVLLQFLRRSTAVLARKVSVEHVVDEDGEFDLKIRNKSMAD